MGCIVRLGAVVQVWRIGPIVVLVGPTAGLETLMGAETDVGVGM